jgi:hypothetical protein
MTCRQVRVDTDDPDRRTFRNPGRGLRLSGKPRDKPDAAGWTGIRPFTDQRHKHSDDYEISFDVSCHTYRYNHTGIDLGAAIV